MKTQREMDSKAGTSKNEISAKLKNVISKTASSLLIAMAGFGMMSFDLQDESINHTDTNVNTNTELVSTDNCCAAEVIKPVIGPKKTMISFTENRVEMQKADAEHARNFAAEEKEMSMWGMNLATARAKADRESVYNFRMSMLYPQAIDAAATDAQVYRMFGEDILQQSAKLAVVNADTEALNKFWKENCTISVKYATTAADAGMVKMFTDAMLPYIAYPSATAIANADAEMVSNHTAFNNVAVK